MKNSIQSAAEIIRVQIKGRDDIGVVISRMLIEGLQIVTADFGTFRISAPAHHFLLLGDA